MIKKLSIFLLMITLLVACQSGKKQSNSVEETGKEVPVAGGSYWDISAAELNTMLQAKDFTFVNVHIPFEGDIAGTDLSIPYNEIEAKLDQLPQDKGAKIVLYCRSDRMSRIAAETMVKLGYTNIWNLDGGMVAWENAGYKLIGQ